MKYLFIFLFLCLSACSYKQTSPRQFVCMTPFTPLSGVQADTSDPKVKLTKDNIEVTTDSGNQIIIPRGQCVEVRQAAQ